MEILSSNQQQIIEQAKFTYSPLGKAFEKKKIEDQGEKQIKAIQNQGQVKTIKKYIYDDEDRPLISKQKEIFNELADKRLDGIIKFDEKVNSENLISRYKDRTDNKFNTYDDALDLVDEIKNGEIKLAEAKNDQIRFKSNLDKIKQGNNKKGSKEQRDTIYDIDTIYKARNEAVKLFDNYSSIESEAKNEAKNKTKQVVKDLKY